MASEWNKWRPTGRSEKRNVGEPGTRPEVGDSFEWFKQAATREFEGRGVYRGGDLMLHSEPGANRYIEPDSWRLR